MKAPKPAKARTHDGHRVSVLLPTYTYACIDWMAAQRRFGTSASDVAAYLIMSGIERFMSLGILPPGAFGTYDEGRQAEEDAESSRRAAIEVIREEAAQRREVARARRRGRPPGSRNRPKGESGN